MTDRKILAAVFGISALVFGLVVYLYTLPKADTMPEWAQVLPTMNASINAACTLLLIISFFAIRSKKVTMHKRLNLTTFFLSCCFLLSYVTYHAFGEHTKFPEDDPLRGLYVIVLLSHILLAAVVLPLVLLSFYHALKGHVKTHRKLARWTFPIWLYVTASGVVVYLMISPHYSFN